MFQDTDKSPKMSNFCRGIYSEQNVKTLLKKSGQSEHSANSLSPPVDTIAFSQTYDVIKFFFMCFNCYVNYCFVLGS